MTGRRAPLGRRLISLLRLILGGVLLARRLWRQNRRVDTSPPLWPMPNSPLSTSASSQPTAPPLIAWLDRYKLFAWFQLVATLAGIVALVFTYQALKAAEKQLQRSDQEIGLAAGQLKIAETAAQPVFELKVDEKPGADDEPRADMALTMKGYAEELFYDASSLILFCKDPPSIPEPPPGSLEVDLDCTPYMAWIPWFEEGTSNSDQLARWVPGFQKSPEDATAVFSSVVTYVDIRYVDIFGIQRQKMLEVSYGHVRSISAKGIEACRELLELPGRDVPVVQRTSWSEKSADALQREPFTTRNLLPFAIQVPLDKMKECS
jgi:hypothetical protein